jgi:2-polyprenyl-3-methyl-5-hydroxy-6-metoxy-1,4-benzoquinol methylase
MQQLFNTVQERLRGSRSTSSHSLHTCIENQAEIMPATKSSNQKAPVRGGKMNNDQVSVLQDAQKSDSERAEREKADRERLEREKADRERAEREEAERERLEREKADRERIERENAEREELGKEKAETPESKRARWVKENRQNRKAWSSSATPYAHAQTSNGKDGNDMFRDLILPTLIEMSGVNDEKKQPKLVLELGCGDGIVCRHFAKLKRTVVGLDYAKEMIIEAKKRDADEKVEIEYGTIDLMDLKEMKAFAQWLRTGKAENLPEEMPKHSKEFKKWVFAFSLHPN